MKTKSSLTGEVQEYSPIDCGLNESETLIDLEIRRALVEADACDFATKEEVKAIFDKWKSTSSNRGGK